MLDELHQHSRNLRAGRVVLGCKAVVVRAVDQAAAAQSLLPEPAAFLLTQPVYT